MQKEEIISLLLRIGVAFAFVYPAVAAFFNPVAWIGFFPSFMHDTASDTQLFVLLQLFGISEIIIALWILSGWRITLPSVLAAIYLALILFFNWQIMDIIFRDIPILFAIIALIILHRQAHQREIAGRPMSTPQ